jgi:tripartite-type tricarboxylate transporter receptor subunit TctC
LFLVRVETFNDTREQLTGNVIMKTAALTRRDACAAVMVGAIALAPLPAVAQNKDYPNRAIRMVVPFAPGGGTDIVGRLLAESLGAALGTNVIVDNRPGGGSTIGTAIVAKATPDGYTTLLNTLDLAVSPSLHKKLPYDPLRDFIPVSLVAEQPNLLVVHSSLPVKTMKELIAHLQAQPGKLTYGSSGVGTATHLATELLLLAVQRNMIHVPYKGIGPAILAMLGNETTMLISTFASALPHVKTGRLRALGVTSLGRASLLPDVPTVAEAGVPGYEFTVWYGFVVPAGTPRAIVDRLNRESVGQLNTASVQQRFDAQGLSVTPSTSAQYVSKLKSEMEKWATAARVAKIQPE